MSRIAPPTIASRRSALPTYLIPLAILVAALAPAQAQKATDATALDRYIAKADDTYSWRLASVREGEFQGQSYLLYVLELHSQSWRPTYEVDRSVWSHWLTIVKPVATRRNKALLYIGGIFMLAILYMVAGFGLLGTVLMSTMERRREFGVMNAVGMRKGRLAAVLFIETLVLVFVGVLIGLIVSTPIMFWFHANPIPVTGDIAEVFEQFNVPPYLPFALDLGIFVAQGLVVLVMALIVASFPIVSIRRLQIMRAITGR